MDLPIICTSGAEFGAKITQFQSAMSPGKGLTPDGQHTMGGISNATTRFPVAAGAAFANLDAGSTPGAVLVATRGVQMLRDIVEPHVFRDGNGRSSMYALYLFMACWGYKLSLPPVALHAFLFGEDQRGSVPADSVERVAPFAKTLATVGEGRSHVTHIERKLKALETTRSNALELKPPPGGLVSAKTGASKFVLSGKDALAHVKDVQAYGQQQADKRIASNARIAKIGELKTELKNTYCNSRSNPWADRAMDAFMSSLNTRIKQFESAHGRLPNANEIVAD